MSDWFIETAYWFKGTDDIVGNTSLHNLLLVKPNGQGSHYSSPGIFSKSGCGGAEYLEVGCADILPVEQVVIVEVSSTRTKEKGCLTF